jgi:sigma-B regulation protein RsbU (phosphoserine phosphatase)
LAATEIGHYSLRTKILISLVGLPLLILSAVLYLSIQTFQKDKVAYIFDSANSITNSFAIQTSSKLDMIKQQVSLLLEKLTSDHQWQAGATEKFKQLDDIDSIVVINLDNLTLPDNPKALDNNKVVTYLEKNRGRTLSILNHPSLLKWITELSRDQKLIFYEKNLELLILGIKKEKYLTLILCFQDLFKNTIKKPGPFILSLIDQANNILVQSDGVGVSELGQIPFRYQYLNTSVYAKNQSGEEFLISYAPVADFALTIGSAIKKKEAFAVISTIIKQSLLVFLMLTCLCVILGVFISDEITSSLYEIFLATKKITEGCFDIRIRIRKLDEIGILGKGINLMTLEIKRLLLETREKARMESELKTAQLVQSTFFPEPQAKYKNCQVIGKYDPASECSGDWWFHFSHQEKVYFIIGDATGHGVPAALLTSAVRSTMNLLFNLNMFSLSEMTSLLNKCIVDVFKSKILMTFLISEYDTQTRILKYINASHDPAFVIRKENHPMNKNKLEFLNDKISRRIGENPQSTFLINQIQLMPGDRVLFYTDGILDLQNRSKQRLGERLFFKFITEAQTTSKNLPEFIEAMHLNFIDFQKIPAKDDITFFTVEVE